MRFFPKIIMACAASFTALNPARADDAPDKSNLKILLAAQTQYQEILRSSQTDYSLRLNRQEAQLNKKLSQAPTLYDKIIILDPVKLDVGKSLGLPDQMVIHTMMLQKGIRPYTNLIDMVGNFLDASTKTTSGHDSFTQNPHALFLMMDDNKKGPCVIIPAPDNTIPSALKIPGLSISESINFSNLHEGWHCLDTAYYPRQLDASVYQSFDPKDLSTLLDKPLALDAYSTLHKAEAFADTAAVGEMIRAGKDFRYLELISEWRREKSEDLIHMSSPVLDGLKTRIESMGLAKFRAMPEKDLRAFYYSVVVDNALHAQSLEVLIKYEQADETTRKDYDRKAKTDYAIASALRFLSQSPSFQISNSQSLTAAFTSILGGKGFDEADIVRQKKISAVLEKWNPMADLENLAWSKDKVIDPLTMSRSYLYLRNRLADLEFSDPKNSDLYEEKASQLKERFVAETADLDYAKINAEYAKKSAFAPLP